ncbi:hypothetical protein DYB26_005278 [Aphanomyces astaci]|uniref:RING-type domain-containing protein n=1 Tax=Aphanomyces astaci TaxID=112090 RepID=A0A3R6Y1Q7_APHAT|nr:hypothetical protein DYB26_005278 [Aphanomyces astaci]
MNTSAKNMSKRRRLRRGTAADANDDDVDLTEDEPEPSLHATECTICCEKCVTSGEHRLASLACGHLFGQSCIERWVKQSKTCPVCSQAVKRNDVRVLFTDSVSVVDNSRQEEFNQKYLAEKAARSAIEMEVAKLKIQHAALQLECDKHKNRVMELLEENSMLKSMALPPPPPSSSQSAARPATWAYAKFASIVCSDSRVCAISLRGDLLGVGTKLGPDSHGLLQVSLLDIQHRASIPLHRLAIRDVAVSTDSKYVATTAMDGKLHIVRTSMT